MWHSRDTTCVCAGTVTCCEEALTHSPTTNNNNHMLAMLCRSRLFTNPQDLKREIASAQRELAALDEFES